MSVQAFGITFDLSDSEKAARLAALSIANHADKYGTAFLSVETILEETRLKSRRSVQDALRALEAMGELVVLVGARGRRVPLYWINLPGLSGQIRDDHPYFEVWGWNLLEEAEETRRARGAKNAPLQGAQKTTSRGAKNDIKGRKKRHRSIREPLVNRKSNRSAPTKCDLPKALKTPLEQVATRKQATLDPPAVLRAVEAYPDRDHAEEAEKFSVWHLERKPNAKIKSIALGFRNWLKQAEPAGGQCLPLQPTSSLDPADFEPGQDKLAEHWPTAFASLRATIKPASSFDLWVAPIVPVGMQGNRVLLSAPHAIVKHTERRYSALISDALRPHIGDVELHWIEQGLGDG